MSECQCQSVAVLDWDQVTGVPGALLCQVSANWSWDMSPAPVVQAKVAPTGAQVLRNTYNLHDK